MITAIAMTGPGTGSDLQGIKTRAVRDGDHYVLNGSKTFITNGISADLVIVVAQTSPEKGRRASRCSPSSAACRASNVDSTSTKVGLDAQDTAELSFTDVKVPVGEPHRRGGHGVHLPHAEPSPGAALDRHHGCRGNGGCPRQRIPATRQGHKAFGKPISSFQNSRFLLAELATEATAVRIMTDRFIRLTSTAKLTADQAQ